MPEQEVLEPTIISEIAAGEDAQHPLHRRVAQARAWVSRHPRLQVGYRIALATVGGIIVLAGIVLLAIPGPGWLTIFLGLAILGTEFHWARRISAWLKVRLAEFWAWWKARRAPRASTAR